MMKLPQLKTVVVQLGIVMVAFISHPHMGTLLSQPLQLTDVMQLTYYCFVNLLFSAALVFQCVGILTEPLINIHLVAHEISRSFLHYVIY